MTIPCTLRLTGICLVGLVGLGCRIDAHMVGATGSFDRTLPVTGSVDLTVRTGSGRIQIHTGPDDRVHVLGSIRAHGDFWTGLGAEEQVEQLETNPPIERSGNTIGIGDIRDPLLQGVTITYDLTVPADTRVRSRSGSGSQSIDGVRGPLEARTGSGSIQIRHIGEHVSASTGSGGIDVSGAGGGLEVRSGSGSIRGDSISGSIHARVGSGRVELKQADAGGVEVTNGSGSISVTGARGPVRLRTGSGPINVEGNPSRDWILTTGSGSIRVHMAAEARFDIDARTSSGNIQTSHPIEVTGTISRRRLEGKVRGGGSRLETFTGSGMTVID